MTPRRREFDKIYNRINKLAQKGSDYVFEYYSLIDEIISNGKYSILEDIMLTKYEISMRAFLSVNSFKEFSFKEIRKFTNYNTAESLQKLLDQKSVYLIGFKLFDKNTNHYLGDIREEQIDNKVFRYNRKLLERSIEVIAEAGINSSAFEVIPRFEANPKLTIRYDEGDHLTFGTNIYQCIQTYTFSSINRISPTFSNFWVPVFLPSYTRLGLTNSNLTLIDKYSEAIDFLKGLSYSFDLSFNEYVETGYVDDYFE
jgi:hypothetical protein